MKKIARWTLAFAAVMSVSGSAMAFPELQGFEVYSSSGRANVPIGKWISSYVQESDNIFINACLHMIKWCRTDYMSRCHTMHIVEENTIDALSCQEATTCFTHSTLSLDSTLPSKGFDVHGNSVPIFRLLGTMDGYSGIVKALVSHHPLQLSRPLTAKPL